MKKINLIILLVAPLVLLSCFGSSRRIVTLAASLEKDRLADFDEIQRSILKVVCSAYYENFYYELPPISAAAASLDSLLIKKQYTTNSVAGTALILQQNATRLLLLSCYHVFDFQDTIKVYYRDRAGNPTANLYSLSRRYDLRIFVTHKDGTRDLGRILSVDETNDLALLETQAQKSVLTESAFLSSLAADDKLEFGKEVYLIGYPKGFLFITRGLINPAPYKNRFLISAAFNRGFSGGVVFAFDENLNNYYYVGMANSMAYDSELVLAPSSELIDLTNYLDFPYNDEIYLKEIKSINYGITFAIKRSVILDFLKREQEKLKQNGFFLPERIL